MKITKNIILVLLMQLMFVFTFGQNPKNQELINQALATKSINEQLNVLVSKSPSFQNFKNLRQNNLDKFIRNFKDSIVATNKKFSDATSKIQNQKKEIEKLNTTINTTKSDLDNITQEKDSIGLFGMRMSKLTYNTILWSIILGLLATTLLFLFKFKNSHSVTKHAKTTLGEIEEEFETHKKSSLEREQVLRRKLQDEINKQRNTK